jgi:hypothetical protein
MADQGEILTDDPGDPMGTAMRQMMGVFAQLDRGMTVVKLRRGRRGSAGHRGVLLSGRVEGGSPRPWTRGGGHCSPVGRPGRG